MLTPRCPLATIAALAWAMAFCLPSTLAQRAVNADHPQGRWEVLDGCQLVPGTTVDGDSFRVLHQGREYVFRLYFVDSPEKDVALAERIEDQAAYFGVHPGDIPRGATQAARFTRERLESRKFTIQTRWQNAMGRGQIARFYGEVLAGGTNLAEALVAAGLARVHGQITDRPDGTRGSTVVNILKNAELSAREQRRGLWNTNDYPRSNTAAVSGSSPPTRPGPTQAPSSVDLNAATFEELQSLPGIGPTLAQRIIAHRPYTSVDDLDRVPGIGAKTLEKLRPTIHVGRRK